MQFVTPISCLKDGLCNHNLVFCFWLLEVIYPKLLLKAWLALEVNQVVHGCVQFSVVNEDVTDSQAPVPVLDYGVRNFFLMFNRNFFVIVVSCLYTKFPRKTCLHPLYISLLRSRNLAIRSFLRLFSRLNPVSSASCVICFSTLAIFMALTGLPPVCWHLSCTKRSESGHSILHTVNYVLKLQRLIMFLVNLFWFSLSLKFCIVFVDLQLLLQPFHIPQYHTDYTAILSMLHISLKLLIYSLQYVDIFLEAVLLYCPLFFWCLSSWYQHICNLIYQTPEFFSELILQICVNNLDYLKTTSSICTHTFCIFSTMSIFSYISLTRQSYELQLPSSRFLVPRNKDFCLDLVSAWSV